MRVLKVLVSITLLMAWGCERVAGSEDRSLVGNFAPVSGDLLKEETVQIELSQFDDVSGKTVSLLIELTPENEVTISKLVWKPWSENSSNTRRPTELRHVRMSDEVGSAVRKTLGRLRPAALSPEIAHSMPLGCQYVSDGNASFTVAYWDRHERAGIFLLQDGCEAESAAAARDVITRAISFMDIAPKEFGIELPRQNQTS